MLKSDDTPQRTAAAYAIGVFCGFCPFMGLHTVLGLAFAFGLGLNRLAVLLGVYSNLPWIVVPWYAGTTVAGAALIGADLPPGFMDRLQGLLELSLFRGDFWRQLMSLMEPLLWPFLIGSTLGSILLAAAAYPAALAFVEARRRHVMRRREARQARLRAATSRDPGLNDRSAVGTAALNGRHPDRHLS